MFENFRQNLEVEKRIINKIKAESSDVLKKSYVNQLKILNYAIPELLKRSSPVESIRNAPANLVLVNHLSEFGNVFVLSEHKKPLLNEISALKKLISSEAKKAVTRGDFTAVRPSIVRTLSNKLFRGTAEKYIVSMKGLTKNIKQANMPILPATYLAMAFLFTFLSVFVGIAIYGFLLFLNLSFWTYFWIIPVIPSVVFVGFFYYPGSEASSVQKNISYELPFSTIHMTAIAGSDIEPTKIFEIVSKSKEYPTVGREIQKILVLIRIYGYDLVTALKNVAARTSNRKFSELLGGLATNISSGGRLKDFLDKKSENYLLDYQLERKKYIELAGTFMDIYISILIAAPMVLMLMFIIMNVAGLGFQGLSIQILMIFSVLGIAIANIFFLIAINLKQPKV